ncbi:MAG: hypothetical protein GF404_05685 [candidate division Zixibacteria bacterium]|jgi:hypothetical protein|nr:hypothetical protein [candidate division Zixibacteria bacterium]
MAKKQTFADKAKKKKQRAKFCSVCESEVENIMIVKSVERPDGKGYKFKHENIGLCKCNEKEVFA